MTARRRVIRALLAVALAGCAAPPALAPAGAPASAQPVPAPPAVPLAPGDYGREPAAALDETEREALEALRPRLSPRGGTLRTSGALVTAARELAQRAADGVPSPIERGSLRAALARALAFDPGPAAYLVADRTDLVPQALARVIPARPATHVGLGAVTRGATTYVVVLASTRLMALDPFPRSVEAGATARLSGRLEGSLQHPRAFVTEPSGEVVELDVRGGRVFSAPARFPAPGRYAVEVVAEGSSGPEVAALVAVSVGGAALDAPAQRQAPEPESVEAAEAGVLRAMNALRSRHRLPPLRADPALVAVARKHSQAMLAAGRLAHVLPGGGGPGDRLREARVPFARVLENVAQGPTALEAHAAAEESPAHRVNLLDPGVTRAGVGVARGRLATGDPTLYLTEMLASGPDDDATTSRLTPEARVREALWGERARLGLPPLTADPALDALAEAAAARLLESDGDDAGEPVRHALALPRRLAALDVFVVGAPRDAVRSANLRDARLRRVGVGLLEGENRRLGGRRLHIAIVYTD